MSRRKASTVSGKGIAFVAFPFFTNQENRALHRLQRLRLAQLAEELKQLERGEILGTSIKDLDEEEFAFQLCELLRHQIREQNRIGIESVKDLLSYRQNGLSPGELQAAMEQLDAWSAYQEAWAIGYYDDYTEPHQESDDHRDQIKRAVWYGVEIAKRELRVIAESVQHERQARSTEDPPSETVSQAEAARRIAELTHVKENRGNVYNLCQPSKRTPPRLQMTIDRRITKASLYEYISLRLFKDAPTAPVGTLCPSCGKDVPKLIGANKVCKECFEREHGLGPA